MKDNVMIGDYLGTIEEFLVGEGTYAENGKIFAARLGEKIIDKEKYLVKVIGKKPLELQVGQTIYGKVFSIKKNLLVLIIKKVQGFNEELEVQAGLFVANISDAYVKKPEDMFGIGDIVKGKIIKIDLDFVHVSTKGENFGVVKAFCRRCRTPLVRSKKVRNKLICENCGNKEIRKIAKDYGNVSKF